MKARGLAGALLLFALLCSLALASPGEQRIRFKTGAVSASVSGRLSSLDDEVRYVVRARAGQHMRITVDSPGPVRTELDFPDGQSFGGPGELAFDDVLPASGDYRLSVHESSMGEPWKGRFRLRVEIRD